MHVFFGKWLPGAKVPDRRKLSGAFLDAAVSTAHAATQSRARGQLATGASDGWRNIAKTNVITSTMTVGGQIDLVRTHDMTGRPKTGDEHAKIIRGDMEHMREVYEVRPIAWVTDDGPDGKGARNILRAEYPWLMTFVCWAHQSNLLAGDYLAWPIYRDTVNAALDIVRWFNNHSSALELFNKEQLYTYPDRTQPLVLILPNLTRWTTHVQSIGRLLLLARALQACVLRNKEQLLEIASKSQTDNAAVTARKVVASIEDSDFWRRLDRVEAHLKPLAVATNLLQATHTRLDHVLLTLANLYRIYNSDDVEPEIRVRMLDKLELRWKKGAGKDQDLFILAVFLNPYIRGYCFNREALAPADLYTMAENAFVRFFDCAPDFDFSDALVDYANCKAEFTDARMRLLGRQEQAERDQDVDLVSIWQSIDQSNDPGAICKGRNGVVKLAIRILSAIANSGGPERMFSDFGITHTKLRNRSSTELVHKTTTVRVSVRRENAATGHVRRRLKRKLGLDYEPQAAVDTTAATAEDELEIPYPDNEDGLLDFQQELVAAAIDSSEPDDIDQEDDNTGTIGSGANLLTRPATVDSAAATLSGPSTAGPLFLSAADLSAFQERQPRQRPARSSARPTRILLKDLFVYPPATTPVLNEALTHSSRVNRTGPGPI
ncbi:hypothetical protein OH77DRAFT_1409607 [Trametes cingulata]|nr:hypothetical protein OH77DRAFT_1409607 [Trametes cingulata]